ncbi:unnamed protein product, partial [Closterium sp. NIES-53]
MDASTGEILATFTREPHSGLFVLHTASGQVAVPCSCRSLAHPTVLWHHRLGHSSIPRLRSMASHRLVSGLPRVFGLLPPSPALPCTPCVAGHLRATPHSSFPLSVLSCFVATRRHLPVHWTAAVRVAKYLATTSGIGLVLGGTQPVELTSHYDSSYADDVETHRSTQGYCFSLGAGAVSWRSIRSSSVALSSAEAEIYAGAMAAQELR